MSCVTRNYFLEAEEMGAIPNKACKQCKTCIECKFINSQLSWTKQKELEAIEKNLQFDPKKQQWVMEYPLTENPNLISNITYNVQLY